MNEEANFEAIAMDQGMQVSMVEACACPVSRLSQSSVSVFASIEGDPPMGSYLGMGQASRAGIERRLREFNLYLMEIDRDRNRLSVQLAERSSIRRLLASRRPSRGTDRSIGHAGTKTVFASRVRIPQGG